MTVIFQVCHTGTFIPAVVHGQGEGRGPMAQQTGLPTTGEAHGKSCDLKDTRQTEDATHHQDSFYPSFTCFYFPSCQIQSCHIIT